MSHGFHVAMYACAVLAALGGVIAWAAITDDALAAEAPADYSCPVTGPPLRRSVTAPAR